MYHKYLFPFKIKLPRCTAVILFHSLVPLLHIYIYISILVSCGNVGPATMMNCLCYLFLLRISVQHFVSFIGSHSVISTDKLKYAKLLLLNILQKEKSIGHKMMNSFNGLPVTWRWLRNLCFIIISSISSTHQVLGFCFNP